MKSVPKGVPGMLGMGCVQVLTVLAQRPVGAHKKVFGRIQKESIAAKQKIFLPKEFKATP